MKKGKTLLKKKAQLLTNDEIEVVAGGCTLTPGGDAKSCETMQTTDLHAAAADEVCPRGMVRLLGKNFF